MIFNFYFNVLYLQENDFYLLLFSWKLFSFDSCFDAFSIRGKVICTYVAYVGFDCHYAARLAAPVQTSRKEGSRF